MCSHPLIGPRHTWNAMLAALRFLPGMSDLDSHAWASNSVCAMPMSCFWE